MVCRNRALALLAGAFLIGGCDVDEGPAEETGEALDDAGAALRDSGEDARNAIEDACEEAREGVDAEDTDC